MKNRTIESMRTRGELPPTTTTNERKLTPTETASSEYGLVLAIIGICLIVMIYVFDQIVTLEKQKEVRHQLITPSNP
jgi:hypothetical protein